MDNHCLTLLVLLLLIQTALVKSTATGDRTGRGIRNSDTKKLDVSVSKSSYPGSVVVKLNQPAKTATVSVKDNGVDNGGKDGAKQTPDWSTAWSMESAEGHFGNNNLAKLPSTRGGLGQVDKSGGAVKIEPATSEGHPDVTLPTWWTEGDLPGYDLGYRSLLGRILALTSEVNPGPPGRACPCSNVAWCRPVNRTVTSEVFSFRVQNKNKTLDYLGYDWSRLSTVALMKHVDDDVMCAAHRHDVRLVFTTSFQPTQLLDAAARAKWISETTSVVVNNFFDGVHLDYEGLMTEPSKKKALNQLYTGLAKAIREQLPSAQVSIDITHSPDATRHEYDYVTLLKASDFAFLRLYDQRRYVTTPQCIAWAMDANNVTLQGIRAYQKLGIPSNKLIPGFGWYGVDYLCTKYHNGTCFINRSAGRCSYKNTTPHSYASIVYFLKDNPSIKPVWDSEAESHHFDYQDAMGKFHQVWYPDLQSLRMRYPLAAKHGLRGVGMWDLDKLDYSNTKMAAEMRREMFGALPRPGRE
nr:chitinase-like protein 3-3 [Arenicola marina]